MSNALAYRGEAGGPVGIALTGASFDMANRAGIAEIRPDITAMAEIADCIGFDPESEKLSPLLVVARATEAGATLRRDTELPEHQGQTLSGMYHLAREIGNESPASINRDGLVVAAKRVGASALTEVSIPDWRQSREAHVRAFAAGLVLAQKPLDLPPDPGFFANVGSFFYKGAVTDRKNLALLDRAANNASLRSPFVLRDQAGTDIILR